MTAATDGTAAPEAVEQAETQSAPPETSAPEATPAETTEAEPTEPTTLLGQEAEEAEDQATPTDEAPEQDGGVDYSSVQLGEDARVGEDVRDAVLGFAKEHNLEPEVAQAILDREQSRAEAVDEAWAGQVVEWEQSVRNDPKLGGTNLPTTINNARAAISRFGPSGWLGKLNESGFGSNPELIAFASAVGAYMGERNGVVHGNDAPGAQGPTWGSVYGNSGDEPGSPQ
jgi:hypothetical protein